MGGVIPTAFVVLTLKTASYVKSLSMSPVSPGVSAGISLGKLFGGYCTGVTLTKGNNTGNSYSVSNLSNNAANFVHRLFGSGRLAASRTVYN